MNNYENVLKSLFCKQRQLNFIKSDFAEQRFSIYENTILNGLITSLKLTYPKTWILLGDSCANLMARRFIYQKYNLPVTACLNDWGEGFYGFLEEQPELKNICYLGEFALFEWYYHLVNISLSEDRQVATSILSNCTENQLDTLKLRFKSNIYLMKFNYRIDIIDEFLIEKKFNERNLNINRDVYYMVMCKNNFIVEKILVKPDLWFFLDLLKKGINLKKAYLLTATDYNSFDLTQAIYFILTNQLIYSIEFNASNL